MRGLGFRNLNVGDIRVRVVIREKGTLGNEKPQNFCSPCKSSVHS